MRGEGPETLAERSHVALELESTEEIDALGEQVRLDPLGHVSEEQLQQRARSESVVGSNFTLGRAGARSTCEASQCRMSVHTARADASARVLCMRMPMRACCARGR